MTLWLGDERMVTHSWARSILGVLLLVIKQNGGSMDACCGALYHPCGISLLSLPLLSPVAIPSGKFKTLLTLTKASYRKLAKHTLRVILNDQKGILSRGAEREKAYRDYRKCSVVKYWVLNRIGVSLNSLRNVLVQRNRRVPTCAFHIRKEMNGDGEE